MPQKYERMTDVGLRNKAEKIVLSYRGSRDAPGFDECLKAEYHALKQQRDGKIKKKGIK